MEVGPGITLKERSCW